MRLLRKTPPGTGGDGFGLAGGVHMRVFEHVDVLPYGGKFVAGLSHAASPISPSHSSVPRKRPHARRLACGRHLPLIRASLGNVHMLEDSHVDATCLVWKSRCILVGTRSCGQDKHQNKNSRCNSECIHRIRLLPFIDLDHQPCSQTPRMKCGQDRIMGRGRNCKQRCAGCRFRSGKSRSRSAHTSPPARRGPGSTHL